MGGSSVNRLLPLVSPLECLDGSVSDVHDSVWKLSAGKAVAIWYLSVSCRWLKMIGSLGEVLDFFPDILLRVRNDGRTSLVLLPIVYGCQQRKL